MTASRLVLPAAASVTLFAAGYGAVLASPAASPPPAPPAVAMAPVASLPPGVRFGMTEAEALAVLGPAWEESADEPDHYRLLSPVVRRWEIGGRSFALGFRDGRLVEALNSPAPVRPDPEPAPAPREVPAA